MYNINTECIYYKRPLLQVKAKHDFFIAFSAETVKKLCFYLVSELRQYLILV